MSLFKRSPGAAAAGVLGLLALLAVLIGTVPSPAPAGAATSVHVQSIGVGWEHRPFVSSDAYFCVTVVDDTNAPVAGAAVTGTVNGVSVGPETTDSRGIAILKRTVFEYGAYVLTLGPTAVTGGPAPYDPSANLVSIASVALADGQALTFGCQTEEPSLPAWEVGQLNLMIADTQAQESILAADGDILSWSGSITHTLTVSDFPAHIFESSEEQFLMQAGLGATLPDGWVRGGTLSALASEEVLGTGSIAKDSTQVRRGEPGEPPTTESSSCQGAPGSVPVAVNAIWFERETDTGREFVLTNLTAGSAVDEAGNFLAVLDCSDEVDLAFSPFSPWSSTTEYVFPVQFDDAAALTCPCSLDPAQTEGKQSDPWIATVASENLSTLSPGSNGILQTVRVETTNFSLSLRLETVRPEFVVNTVDDVADGFCNADHCSLRDAIIAANLNPGKDTITFDIPGAGQHTIQVSSALPVITGALAIDASGQALIELVGGGAVSNGLSVVNTGLELVEMAINRFPGAAVVLQGEGPLVLTGNIFGTDVTATVDLANGADLQITRNVSVGGATVTVAARVSGEGNVLRKIVTDGSGQVNITFPTLTVPIIDGKKLVLELDADASGTVEIGSTTPLEAAVNVTLRALWGEAIDFTLKGQLDGQRVTVESGGFGVLRFNAPALELGSLVGPGITFKTSASATFEVDLGSSTKPFSGGAQVDAELGVGETLTLKFTGNISEKGVTVGGAGSGDIVLTMPALNVANIAGRAVTLDLSGGLGFTANLGSLENPFTGGIRAVGVAGVAGIGKLTLSGNYTTGGVDVDLSGASGTVDVTFEELTIDNVAGTGISLKIDGGLGGTVNATDVTVTNAGGDGIFAHVAGSVDLTGLWTNFRTNGNGNNGKDIRLAISAQLRLDLYRDASDRNVGYGLEVRVEDLLGVGGLNLSASVSSNGGTLIGNGSGGVWAVGANVGLTWSDEPNTISSNGGPGILFDGATGTVTGDTISGNAVGILIRNGGDVTISGTTISNSVGAAISVQGSSRAQITGNTISGNGVGISAEVTATVQENGNTFAGNIEGDVDLNVAAEGTRIVSLASGFTALPYGGTVTATPAEIVAGLADPAALVSMFRVDGNVWLSFAPGWPAAANTLTTIDPWTPLLLRLSAPTTWSGSFATPGARTVPLGSGLTFVTYTGDGVADAADVLSEFSEPGAVIAFFRYEQEEQSWRSFRPGAPPSVNTLAAISQFDAILVLTTQEMDWSIPAPQ